MFSRRCAVNHRPTVHKHAGVRDCGPVSDSAGKLISLGSSCICLGRLRVDAAINPQSLKMKNDPGAENRDGTVDTADFKGI